MATKNLIQAITSTLQSEMDQDDRIVVLGQDVGIRGGVFLATDGLVDRFGTERVIDTPLSEAAIVGAALGLAMNGMRPVAEIQFADYIFPGFDQLVSEVAKMRYRSGAQFTAPLVIRMPSGGGVGGGHHHSQSPETYFLHTPGLKVVYPSTPTDAAGLLRASIHDDDPVVFMEPKRLYRATRSEVPDDPNFTIPLGKADVIQNGDDVVLISYGGSMAETRLATQALSEQGINATLIDLRSLMPWDHETVLEHVARVGRVVLVSEAPRTLNFMSEVSSVITEEILDSLHAPPLRVTGWDTPYPYAQDREYLPSPNRILRAVERVLQY